MTIKELQQEKAKLLKQRDELRKRAEMLQAEVERLQSQPKMTQIAAEGGKVYTEFLLEIKIPYAEKNPKIPDIEKAIKNELSKRYTVLKVKVEEYNLAAYSDPTFGVYYSGNMVLRVRLLGDLPLSEGDTFIFDKNEVIPVRGAVIIEAIILIASIIALLVAADRFGGKILKLWKGLLEETEKHIPLFLVIGGMTIGGLLLLWLIKRG